MMSLKPIPSHASLLLFGNSPWHGPVRADPVGFGIYNLGHFWESIPLVYNFQLCNFSYELSTIAHGDLCGDLDGHPDCSRAALGPSVFNSWYCNCKFQERFRWARRLFQFHVLLRFGARCANMNFIFPALPQFSVPGHYKVLPRTKFVCAWLKVHFNALN